MFDCHYDLLTYILMKKDEPDFLKNYCASVYNDNNITGGIFNLFYMLESEMKEELGFEKEQINVIENLKEVKNYIDSANLFSNKINYIFGIEGLDYLEKIDDIDILYSFGLRSTNPVWNNQNKFGGGSKTDNKYGLTKLGELLIKKLVHKNIAIDLSHTNESTFFDIINLCKNLKKAGENPIVFASHSNVRFLCNVSRNLSDEQIFAIKELGGVIGVVSIKKFCVDTNDICNPDIDFEKYYIEHILYIKNLLGDVQNISLATDDMRYYFIEPEYYQNANIYLHFEVREKIEKALLRNGFSISEIECIMHKNFENKILNRLNKL